MLVTAGEGVVKKLWEPVTLYSIIYTRILCTCTRDDVIV